MILPVFPSLLPLLLLPPPLPIDRVQCPMRCDAMQPRRHTPPPPQLQSVNRSLESIRELVDRTFFFLSCLNLARSAASRASRSAAPHHQHITSHHIGRVRRRWCGGADMEVCVPLNVAGSFSVRVRLSLLMIVFSRCGMSIYFIAFSS